MNKKSNPQTVLPITDKLIEDFALEVGFGGWSEWDGGDYQKMWLTFARMVEVEVTKRHLADKPAPHLSRDDIQRVAKEAGSGFVFTATMLAHELDFLERFANGIVAITRSPG